MESDASGTTLTTLTFQPSALADCPNGIAADGDEPRPVGAAFVGAAPTAGVDVGIDVPLHAVTTIAFARRRGSRGATALSDKGVMPKLRP
jgi:hypothetical protein